MYVDPGRPALRRDMRQHGGSYDAGHGLTMPQRRWLSADAVDLGSSCAGTVQSAWVSMETGPLSSGSAVRWCGEPWLLLLLPLSKDRVGISVPCRGESIGPIDGRDVLASPLLGLGSHLRA